MNTVKNNIVCVYQFTYERIASYKNAASIEAALHLQVSSKIHKTGELAQLLHHFKKVMIWKWITGFPGVEQLRNQGRLKKLIGFKWH